MSPDTSSSVGGLSVSCAALVRVGVTGFTTCTAPFIYLCSVAWLCALISADAVAYASDEWKEAQPAIAASIVFTGTVLVFQTIDFLFLHFAFWPVTAINWTGQLAALGCDAAAVCYAAVVYDADRDTRITGSLLSLTAQALFTASQLGVTLEYIERSLRKSLSATPPRPCPTTVTRVGRSGSGMFRPGGI